MFSNEQARTMILGSVSLIPQVQTAIESGNNTAVVEIVQGSYQLYGQIIALEQGSGMAVKIAKRIMREAAEFIQQKSGVAEAVKWLRNTAKMFQCRLNNGNRF